MSGFLLGIETSCDETSASIMTADGVALSNVIYSQIELHNKYGGIVPELASRDHALKIEGVVEEAFRTAKVYASQISAVGVTAGPGLLGCILVGLSFAKAFALARDIPLIGVDHVMAHALSTLIKKDASDVNKPEYPFLAMVVSGGHTSIYLVDSVSEIQRLSSTVDDAAGEIFDKVARFMGLGYPGGKILSDLAKKGDSTKFKFTKPNVKGRPYDFSFSGLKTAAINYARTVTSDSQELKDLSASFQEVICNTLVEKMLMLAKEKGIKDLVIGGGVAANYRLRELLQERSKVSGLRSWLVPVEYCTDNAAMIANYARLALKKEHDFTPEMAKIPAYSTTRK
jgi:N6-L-threonylcarbamoyladenine synthase